MTICRIIGYEKEENKFVVKVDNNDVIKTYRINILFNSEDPRQFAKRISTAHKVKAKKIQNRTDKK